MFPFHQLGWAMILNISSSLCKTFKSPLAECKWKLKYRQVKVIIISFMYPFMSPSSIPTEKSGLEEKRGLDTFLLVPSLCYRRYIYALALAKGKYHTGLINTDAGESSHLSFYSKPLLGQQDHGITFCFLNYYFMGVVSL